YNPSFALRVARGSVETARLLAGFVSLGLGLATLVAVNNFVINVGWWLAALLSGVTLLVAGAVACCVAAAAKWLVVGRIGREE
ncbi:hypothetical protein PJM50_30360, partial [Mycobacterium kansasii]